MEGSRPSSDDVLDFLFDDSYGLLNDVTTNFDPKQNVMNPVENIEFPKLDLGDFGILGDLEPLELTSFMDNAEPFTQPTTKQTDLEGEPAMKKRIIFSDHDYVAHRSPGGNSDSGVSVISDDSSSSLNVNPENNLTDDQLSMFVNKLCDPGASPNSSCSDSQTYELYDQTEQTGNQLTHTVDTTTADLEDFDFNFTNEDDISIDFDLDNLKEVDPASVDAGHQVFVVSGSNRKLIAQSGGSLPFTVKDVDPSVTSSNPFPELRLTDEEKELLSREGVTLPTNLPLTRDEERMLKAVRRKIRNKISAKESRKRKQGYVDGLEQRVKLCTQENRELQKKVENLQKQNVSLVAQMKKLQTLMGKSKVPAQASTCAMVLLLSMALLVAPNMNPFGEEEDAPQQQEGQAVKGNARSLLQENPVAFDSADASTDSDPYGVSQRPAAPYGKPAPALQNKTGLAALNAGDTAGLARLSGDGLARVKEEPRSPAAAGEDGGGRKRKLADLYPELTKRIKAEPVMAKVEAPPPVVHTVKVEPQTADLFDPSSVVGASETVEAMRIEEIDVEN